MFEHRLFINLRSLEWEDFVTRYLRCLYGRVPGRTIFRRDGLSLTVDIIWMAWTRYDDDHIGGLCEQGYISDWHRRMIREI
jgi:hypothetical protein